MFNFFYRIFIKLNRKFLKISQQFAFFVQKREKRTPFLLRFLGKCAKIMHFSYFVMKSFENFRKFSQNSPTLSVFRPKAPKINALFVKFH